MKKKFLFWWCVATPAVILLNTSSYGATGRYMNLVAAALWATVFIMVGLWRFKQYNRWKAEQQEERDARVDVMKAQARAANAYADKTERNM